MLMRRDFYSRNKVYLPRDPMSRGIIPDNHHIFAPNDSVSLCLNYECEKKDEKVSEIIFSTFFYYRSLIIFFFFFA